MNERGKFRKDTTQRKSGSEPKSDADTGEEIVFGYIVRAMEHFAGNERALDEASLVRICLAGGAKSPTQARKVIAWMVRRGILKVQITNGIMGRSYYIPRPMDGGAN